MIYISSTCTDPTWNLALEEYAQTSLTQFPHILMLWQNDNSIIVGRYQNMAREINSKAARDLDVRVVRRSTGGGTVYHDMGNLNFSLIVTCPDKMVPDKGEISKPIVEALQKIGIDVVLSGRNDMLLNGKKISGTAQSMIRNRFLHHGTLLYDSNMNTLASVLNVDPTKLQSKGITSVKSRVTNIRSELGLSWTTAEFWAHLREAFTDLEEYQLTDEDLQAVEKIRAEKYSAWDWNVGKEPDFGYESEHRFAGGLLTLQYNVARGKLLNCRISGDYLGLLPIGDLESALNGAHFNKEEIASILSGMDLMAYLGEITAEDFLECMFGVWGQV